MEQEDMFLKELEAIEDKHTKEWLSNKKETYGFVSDKVYKTAYEKIQKDNIETGRVEIIEYADGTSAIRTSRLTREERDCFEIFEKAMDLEKEGNIQEAIEIYLTLIDKKLYPYENAYKRLVIIHSKLKDFEKEIELKYKSYKEDILFYLKQKESELELQLKVLKQLIHHLEQISNTFAQKRMTNSIQTLLQGQKADDIINKL
jgi:hypothetical protein